ncbi:MAG: PKD domain-containing protein [Nitrospirae bacterium]|nr:PKD domain-containing protein [Nitrospirota bacterium]
MKSTNKVMMVIAALFALVIPLMVAGSAGAMYLTDGTKEVSAGVYENPNDGMCIVGVAANGDMLVDTSITNARDCVAYTTGLTGMTTSAQCTTAGGVGNDGYKHTWATSNTCINAANPSVAISLVDLDRTLAMCISRGGTTLTTTGTCVAYGWQYRNRKADGTVPVVANKPATTKGVVAADALGFCYAPVRMTTAGTFDALTCPSINNLPKYCNEGTKIGEACTDDTTCTGSVTVGRCARNTTDWPDCASNNPTPASASIGCQTPAAYEEGLGWSYASGQCIYAYGVNGFANATITKADGTTYAAAAAVNPGAYTTQGDCLSQGFSWDNWLPIGATSLVSGVSTTLGNTDYRKFDTTTSVALGGGKFHSSTGAVCTKCHSDQSRSYMERNKPAYIHTGHKSAGDDPTKPWTTNFTEANSAWKIKGVQCNVCHGTARPGQADLIQVSTGTTPAPAGTAKYASGHQNLALGSAATQLCFYCHGTPTSPLTNKPAEVIPVAAGEFTKTSKGLAPLSNQFLNSPHAKYTGDSVPLSLTTKTNYGSTFIGFNCRTSANGSSYLTTVYQSGEVGLIHFLDSLTNTDCTNPGDGSATSGAAGVWQREGSNIDSATANRTDQGNCTTCHDVHWSLDSTEQHAEPFRRECHTCHTNPAGTSASGAPQIAISLINHLKTANTPFDTSKYVSPCEVCHMPKLTSAGSRMHLWRINTDEAYSTAGTSTANLAGAANLAYVDLNAACGQCHGGDGPEQPDIPYFTKAQLADVAKGMHASAGVSYPATFTIVPTGLTADVTASVNCNGVCPPLTYDWTWGDGSANGTGASASHTYATAGTKSITLVVSLTSSGGIVGSVTRSVSLTLPPTPLTAAIAGGACTWDAKTWTISCTDASSGGNAPLTIVMDWGDGTSKSVGAAGATFTHTYSRTGAFTPLLRANDRDLRTATVTSNQVSPKYFIIGGTVKNRLGTATLSNALVQLKLDSSIVKTLITSPTGTFTSGKTLRPGNYTIEVTKSSYTFPTTFKTIGPNKTTIVIKASTP